MVYKVEYLDVEHKLTARKTFSKKFRYILYRLQSLNFDFDLYKGYFVWVLVGLGKKTDFLWFKVFFVAFDGRSQTDQ